MCFLAVLFACEILDVNMWKRLAIEVAMSCHFVQIPSIGNGKSVPLSHHLYKVKMLKLSSHQPILRDV